MEIKYILLILGFLIILVGTNMIFGARKFINKNFPKGDVNNATLGMKMVGVVVCILGLFLAYFNINT